MKPVQIVMDAPLLKAVDRAARKARMNRSALVREALRGHLQREHVRELEERHRAGYQASPPDEFEAWDRVVAWPED